MTEPCGISYRAGMPTSLGHSTDLAESYWTGFAAGYPSGAFPGGYFYLYRGDVKHNIPTEITRWLLSPPPSGPWTSLWSMPVFGHGNCYFIEFIQDAGIFTWQLSTMPIATTGAPTPIYVSAGRLSAIAMDITNDRCVFVEESVDLVDPFDSTTWIYHESLRAITAGGAVTTLFSASYHYLDPSPDLQLIARGDSNGQLAVTPDGAVWGIGYFRSGPDGGKEPTWRFDGAFTYNTQDPATGYHPAKALWAQRDGSVRTSYTYIGGTYSPSNWFVNPDMSLTDASTCVALVYERNGYAADDWSWTAWPDTFFGAGYTTVVGVDLPAHPVTDPGCFTFVGNYLSPTALPYTDGYGPIELTDDRAHLYTPVITSNAYPATGRIDQISWDTLETEDSFPVADPYDPLSVWSIAVDDDGNMLVAGDTRGYPFPDDTRLYRFDSGGGGPFLVSAPGGSTFFYCVRDINDAAYAYVAYIPDDYNIFEVWRVRIADGTISFVTSWEMYSFPGGITSTPDGGLWFSGGDVVEHWSPGGGHRIFTLPYWLQYLQSSALARPNGHAWFTARSGSLGAPGPALYGIDVSPDGVFTVEPCASCFFPAPPDDEYLEHAEPCDPRALISAAADGALSIAVQPFGLSGQPAGYFWRMGDAHPESHGWVVGSVAAR